MPAVQLKKCHQTWISCSLRKISMSPQKQPEPARIPGEVVCWVLLILSPNITCPLTGLLQQNITWVCIRESITWHSQTFSLHSHIDKTKHPMGKSLDQGAGTREATKQYAKVKANFYSTNNQMWLLILIANLMDLKSPRRLSKHTCGCACEDLSLEW